MSSPGLPKPPSPIPGITTHYSIELKWEEYIDKANKAAEGLKGDARIRVLVEQKAPGNNDNWNHAYSGYARHATIEGLVANTLYRFRMRFSNGTAMSEWSDETRVTSGKEPLHGEHIHRAITNQDMDALQKVLDSKKVPLDCEDKFGYTPLMIAVQNGYIEMMTMMLDYGADVNYQNAIGKTALMIGAFTGRIQVVKELRSHGADIDLTDNGGSSVLHYAVDSRNVDMIEFLLAEGGDLRATDDIGWTPLMRLAALNGDKDTSSLLIRYGADVNHKDRDGKSVLMVAVVNGHLGMVESLLERNVDLDVTNEFGKTPLEVAQTIDKKKIAVLLVEAIEQRKKKH